MLFHRCVLHSTNNQHCCPHLHAQSVSALAVAWGHVQKDWGCHEAVPKIPMWNQVKTQTLDEMSLAVSVEGAGGERLIWNLIDLIIN